MTGCIEAGAGQRTETVNNTHGECWFGLVRYRLRLNHQFCSAGCLFVRLLVGNFDCICSAERARLVTRAFARAGSTEPPPACRRRCKCRSVTEQDPGAARRARNGRAPIVSRIWHLSSLCCCSMCCFLSRGVPEMVQIPFPAQDRVIHGFRRPSPSVLCCCAAQCTAYSRGWRAGAGGTMLQPRLSGPQMG